MAAIRFVKPSVGPKRPPRVVVAGPRGSGVTTQAKILADGLNAIYLCPEDLLQREIKNRTELGRDAMEYTDRNQPVPDSLWVDIVLDYMCEPDAHARGYVLEGFPCTEPVARMLKTAGAAHVLPNRVVWLSSPTEFEESERRLKEAAKLTKTHVPDRSLLELSLTESSIAFEELTDFNGDIMRAFITDEPAQTVHERVLDFVTHPLPRKDNSEAGAM
eukprot:726940_1